MGTCNQCNKERNTRPYGPGGSLICFDCAFATPESTKRVKANLGAQRNACGDVAVIDGHETGVRPAHFYTVHRN